MEGKEIIKKVIAIKLQEGRWEASEDFVIEEYSLNLYADGKFVREFNCTPQELEDLVVGGLYTTGLIHRREDVLSLDIDVSEGVARASLAECSDVVETSRPPLNPDQTLLPKEDIFRMMEENLTQTELFKKTGGVHSVSLYDLIDRRRMIYRQDAARHNAVDKLLGSALREKRNLKESILVVSGRISGDIMDKARLAGIPVVLSKAAPTIQSVEKAQAAGITLVGFIRGLRMNIYANPQRILLPDQVFGEISRIRREEEVIRNR